MRFNYIDYLKDAKAGILNTAEETSNWSCRYDVITTAGLTNSNPSTLEIKSKQQQQQQQKENISSSNKLLSNDLDNDVEEFFFHLNLSTTIFNNDPSRSTRSTMNLFNNTNRGEQQNRNNNYESDSMIDFDETTSLSSQNKKLKNKSSMKAKATVDVNSKKSERSRRRKRSRGGCVANNNDFYILSFDNEISESSSSSSSSMSSPTSSTCSLDKIEQKMTTTTKHSSEDEDDEEETNNKGTEMSISSGNTCEAITIPNRQNLVDFLFSNESNNKIYLNSNLNNFLTGLDQYFAQSFVNDDKKIKFSQNNLNQICNEIANIYDELLAFEPSSVAAKAEVVVNLTEFPAFVAATKLTADSSLQTSTQSLNTTSQITTGALDSGVEMNCSSSKEDDIGPFLCALFNRLDHMLNNSLQINFLITGIFARLAFYPQLLLRSFLLNNNLVLQPNIKSLIQVLF